MKLVFSLLGLGFVGATLPAAAQVFEGSIGGYCRYIAPPGDDQPLTLTTPIPDGRTVHLDVVMSGNVTLASVDDVGHNGYTVVGGGVDGAFTARLVVAEVAAELPTGNSITVHLASSGGGGTSCASAFLVSGVNAAPEQSGFATGSGTSPAITTGALGSAHELVQTVLFGQPTGARDPVAARVAPLADAGFNLCVGTSNGRLCSFDSYALVDTADPFTAAIDLDQDVSWGFAFATFEAASAAFGGGSVLAWGSNEFGQATVPDAVSGVSGTAIAIAAGGLHNCAIRAGSRAVVCWGDNTEGQSTPPDSVNGTAGRASAIAVSDYTSCAIQAGSGAVVCWGYNLYGEATPPASVDGSAGTASAIAVGGAHSCAIQAGSGAVVCWGDNSYGVSTPPTSVDGNAGTATTIAAGYYHSCAIQAGSGAVVCWGLNDTGQATPPAAVNGTSGRATSLAAGRIHSCAIQAGTRAVVCWGGSSPPDSVNGTAGAASKVAAGWSHSCAIQAGSGAVVCWGSNTDGEATPPVSVDGSAGRVTAIAAGGGLKEGNIVSDTLAIVPEPEVGPLAWGAGGTLLALRRRLSRGHPGSQRSPRRA
jgi:alpha-tubulin suppressor-like RCC1 family protein